MTMIFNLTLASLFVAWILTWFTLDHLFIKALKELFDKDVSSASYYFLFLVFGLISDLLMLLKLKG